nr:MAG: dihydroorotate dehydrogenase [Bacillota bacterium]
MTGEVDLSVEIAGIRFPNPVWVASGCFNYGREFAHLYPLRELGAVCTKGTAPEPWPGNPGVRMAETPAGMLNAIGLMNPGIDHYLQVDGPWLRAQGVKIVVNIVGRTVEEYVRVAERLTPEVADAVELNISCPNVKEGGLAFGTSPRATYGVTAAVRRATSLPLFVKLSPNVTDITELARAAEAAGADGLTLINTLLGMAIDIRRRRPVLGNVFGGLSGPAIKPIALRMVWQVVGAVRIPVVGIGGIATAQDALEFLMAGARAVQVGTACFANPRAPLEIIAGIRQFMVENGIRRVTELIGAARPAGEAALGNLPPLGDAGADGRLQPLQPGPGSRTGAGEALRQWLKDADRA